MFCNHDLSFEKVCHGCEGAMSWREREAMTKAMHFEAGANLVLLVPFCKRHQCQPSKN